MQQVCDTLILLLSILSYTDSGYSHSVLDRHVHGALLENLAQLDHTRARGTHGPFSDLHHQFLTAFVIACYDSRPLFRVLRSSVCVSRPTRVQLQYHRLVLS
jgi:hypothetical protein